MTLDSRVLFKFKQNSPIYQKIVDIASSSNIIDDEIIPIILDLYNVF